MNDEPLDLTAHWNGPPSNHKRPNVDPKDVTTIKFRRDQDDRSDPRAAIIDELLVKYANGELDEETE